MFLGGCEDIGNSAGEEASGLSGAAGVVFPELEGEVEIEMKFLSV